MGRKACVIMNGENIVLGKSTGVALGIVLLLIGMAISSALSVGGWHAQLDNHVADDSAHLTIDDRATFVGLGYQIGELSGKIDKLAVKVDLLEREGCVGR